MVDVNYSPRYYSGNRVLYHDILIKKCDIVQLPGDIPVVIGKVVQAACLISKRIRFFFDDEIRDEWKFSWELIKSQLKKKIQLTARNVHKARGYTIYS